MGVMGRVHLRGGGVVAHQEDRVVEFALATLRITGRWRRKKLSKKKLNKFLTLKIYLFISVRQEVEYIRAGQLGIYYHLKKPMWSASDKGRKKIK